MDLQGIANEEPDGDTPYFLAVVALEQYRSRLLNALRFIEDASSARVPIPPAEVESKLNSWVEYVFAGEQDFVSAQDRCRAHETAFSQLAQLKSKTVALRARIGESMSALEEEAQQLTQDIADIRWLLSEFESDSLTPLSTYDAVGALAEHVRVCGPASLPVGWRLGHDLPGSRTSASGSGSGMSAAQARGEVGAAHGGIVEALEPAPKPKQDDVPMASTRRGSVPAKGTVEGEAVQVQGIVPASAQGASGATSTVPGPSKPGLMAMLGTLPPAARGKLLALLPAGWKPGDPLPPALLAQDPRKLLADLMGK